MKGLFIEEVDSKKSESVKQESNKEAQAPLSVTNSQIEQILNISDVEGRVDDKFLEILLGAMNQANQDGFDYLEFKRSLVSLREMEMDASTRFKSAYAMAKAMNASPAGLESSARHYLKVLEAEDKKFLDALSAQSEKRLTGRKQEIADQEKQVAAWKQEILDLQAKIEDAQGAVAQMKEELDASEEKLRNTAANFQASYEHLRGQIESDLQNITKYIQD